MRRTSLPCGSDICSLQTVTALIKLLKQADVDLHVLLDSRLCYKLFSCINMWSPSNTEFTKQSVGITKLVTSIVAIQNNKTRFTNKSAGNTQLHKIPYLEL